MSALPGVSMSNLHAFLSCSELLAPAISIIYMTRFPFSFSLPFRENYHYHYQVELNLYEVGPRRHL